MATEANQKAPEVATDATDGRKPRDTQTTAQESSGQREPDAESEGEQTSPENGETETTPPDSTEQRRTDRETDSPSDSFEQRPSYGNFDNLGKEFDARAKSREQANALNSGSEESKPDDEPQSYDFKVDDKSLREHIDPGANNADVAGTSETGSGPAGDRTFTAIEEGDNDTRSRAERFREKVGVGSEDLLGKVKSSVNKGVEVFGPRPTGQETRTPHGGPELGDVPHPGIDPGTAAAGMLALGIVGSELIRKIRKTRGRDTE